MKPFKYDLVKLIEAVRDRPCLWDKTIDNYKDRLERRTAWVEIFNLLDEQYEDMTPEEKRSMEEQVQMKWVNVRDSFVRSIKARGGRPRRKYILYEHVKFLNKIMPEQPEYSEDPGNYPNDRDPDVNYEAKNPYLQIRKKRSRKRETSEESTSKVSDEDSDSKEPIRRKRKTKRVYDVQKDDDNDGSPINYVQIDDNNMNDPRIMNEDEAFFASLLPTVVRYNEDDRLEFRIEVLEIMRKIKDKKQWSGETFS